MRNVEDIYPLSPMQQGMLFHTLLAPRAGDYLTQLSGTIEGARNLAALEHAWAEVIRRHSILRTAFVWEGCDEPLQIVHREVSLPCERRDLKHMSAAQQEDAFERFLTQDRVRGFDLAVAPLMRLTVFEIDERIYRFVWTHHHLLLDGWSLPLVMQEIFGFASAWLDGRTLQLPAAKPYRDYVAWLAEQDEQQAERYWRGALAGFSAPTAIGNITAGDPAPHCELKRSLARSVTDKLKTIARQHQITLNTTIQGAWALLLHQYSGEGDVVFGATVAGRPAALPGVESMVGLFINTQPVRSNMQADDMLLPWLSGLQMRHTEAREFEHCRLTSIHGWSEVPRELPLFESLMIFENYPPGVLNSAAGSILPVRDVRVVETTNYPLALIVSPGTELELRLNYDTGRFDNRAIARMMDHLERLLEAVAHDPERRLSELPLLSPAEEQRMLNEWNRTEAPLPNLCVHELFEQRAARTPHAPAVVFEDTTLTYSELNARANRLAHALRRLGVGPEVLVAIALDRSPEMIVAILAVLKAGGAYLPLAIDQPAERIDYLLKDACPRLLISTFGLPGFGPVNRVDSHLQSRDHRERSNFVERINADDPALANESAENPEPLASMDNLAYVIYTSGSTGRPKGVMIAHRGLTNLALAQQKLFEVSPSSRVLQFAAPTFDASVSEIFVTLVSGAALHLARREQLLPGPDLLHLLETQAISVATLPPSVLAALPDRELPELQTLVVAGEACTPELVRRWGRGRRMINAYGPTEATVCATAGECQETSACVPIGRPIQNTKIYVVDSSLRAVPVGVPGELLIGGAGVARGYLQRPELTSERFLADPFRMEPGARVYRTGDRVRYREDGTIEFLGRMDRQVKIRGFRIEPGEIEAVLNDQPGVREAVVIDREDQPGNRRLVAYVARRAWAELRVSELRAALERRLPEYLIPAAFVVLDELPLTPHGKVDRAALPAPGSERPDLDKPFTPPRNALEEVLAGMWSDVLHMDNVGIHDNFFESGGHSLLAMQLLSRIRETFDFELPIQALFSNPTIAGLASEILSQNPLVERTLAAAAGLTDDELEMLVGVHNPAD